VDENNPIAVREAPPEVPAPSPAAHRGFVAEWTVTVILLLFGTTNLLQAFVIPTGSMEDTLLVGDHLLVDKMAYAPPDAVSKFILPYRDVRRGDIIVFRYPVDIQQTFVKRCIGVPGDRIHLLSKRLFLNGRPVDEPYVFHKSPYIDDYRDYFPRAGASGLPTQARDMLDRHLENGDVVVPPGYYFAMGDNRDNSLDSRYWGFVPRANIIGKPLIIYWSYDASTSELTDNGLNVAHLLDIVLHFPAKTRWERSMRLIHGYPLN
jgi:signal peptidase I